MTASASAGCWRSARCRICGVYGPASKPSPTSRRMRADRSASRSLCVARAMAWCRAWSAIRASARLLAPLYRSTAALIAAMSLGSRRSAAVRAMSDSVRRR